MSEFTLAGFLEIQGIQGLPRVLNDLQSQLRNIPAVTNMSRSFDKAGDSAKRAKTEIASIAPSIGVAATSAQDFADKAALALRRFTAFTVAAGTTYGIARAVFGGLKDAAIFERELIKVQQVTNASQGVIAELREEIGRLGVSLAAPASELADVSRVLSQAGLSVGEVKTLLESISRTRLSATFGDVGSTTEGVVAIMGQFKIPADEIIKSLGLINAAAGSYAVESEQLISSIKRTGGAFAVSSQGIVEGNEALAQFNALITSVIQTTRQAPESVATGLRTIIARLQRPGTIDFLQGQGISLRDAEGNFIGVYNAIQKIGAALENVNPLSARYAEIIEKIGGARQYGVVVPLIKEFRLQQEILNTQFQRQADFIRESEVPLTTLIEKFRVLQNTWANFSRDVFNGPVFQFLANQALELANSLVKVLDNLSDIIPLIALLGTAKAATAFYREGVAGVFKSRLLTGHGAPGIVHRASGGYIPGFGSGDKQLVMAEAGEFMIRKKAAQALGAETLNKLNTVDKFQQGGFVGKKVFSITKKQFEKLPGTVFHGNLEGGIPDNIDSSIEGGLRLGTKRAAKERIITRYQEDDYLGFNPKAVIEPARILPYNFIPLGSKINPSVDTDVLGGSAIEKIYKRKNLPGVIYKNHQEDIGSLSYVVSNRNQIRTHKDYIKLAKKMGYQISPEVLADYPGEKFARGGKIPKRSSFGVENLLVEPDPYNFSKIGKKYPVSLLRNPSISQSLQYLENKKQVRFLVNPTTGDYYLWDGSKAVHDQVAKELGIDLLKIQTHRFMTDFVSGDETEIKVLKQLIGNVRKRKDFEGQKFASGGKISRSPFGIEEILIQPGHTYERIIKALRNPTFLQSQQFLEQTKQQRMRGLPLIGSRDYYVFDAYDAAHPQVTEALTGRYFDYPVEPTFDFKNTPEDIERLKKFIKLYRKQQIPFRSIQDMPRRFATGGYIPGMGSGDKTPILAEAGEFVIRKRAARMLGEDTLNKLNSVDKFRTGGFIGKKKYAGGGLVLPAYQDGGEIEGKEFEQIRKRFRNIFKGIFQTRELQAGLVSYEKLLKVTESLGVQFSDVGNNVSSVFNKVSNEIRKTARTPAEAEKLFRGLIQAVQVPVTKIIPTGTSESFIEKRTKPQELVGGGTTTGRLEIPLTKTAKEEINAAKRLESLRAANYTNERRRRKEFSKSIVFEKSLLQEVQDSIQQDVSSKQELAIGNYPQAFKSVSTTDAIVNRRINLEKLRKEPSRLSGITGRKIEDYQGRVPQRLLREERTIVSRTKAKPLSEIEKRVKALDAQIQKEYDEAVSNLPIIGKSGKTGQIIKQQERERSRLFLQITTQRDKRIADEASIIQDELRVQARKYGKTDDEVKFTPADFKAAAKKEPVAGSVSRVKIPTFVPIGRGLTENQLQGYLQTGRSSSIRRYEGKTLEGRGAESYEGLRTQLYPRQIHRDAVSRNINYRAISKSITDGLTTGTKTLVRGITTGLGTSISKTLEVSRGVGRGVTGRAGDPFALGLASVFAQDFLPKLGVGEVGTGVVSGALGGASAGAFLGGPQGAAIGAIIGGLNSFIDSSNQKELSKVMEDLIGNTKQLDAAFKDLSRIGLSNINQLVENRFSLQKKAAEIEGRGLLEKTVNAFGNFDFSNAGLTAGGSAAGAIGLSTLTGGLAKAITASLASTNLGLAPNLATASTLAAPILTTAAAGAAAGLGVYAGGRAISRIPEGYGFSDEQQNLKKFRGNTSVIADAVYRAGLDEVRINRSAQNIASKNAELAAAAKQSITDLLRQGREKDVLNNSGLLRAAVSDRADLLKNIDITGRPEFKKAEIRGQELNALTEILPELKRRVDLERKVNDGQARLVATVENFNNKLLNVVKATEILNAAIDSAQNQLTDIYNVGRGDFAINQKFDNPFEYIEGLNTGQIKTAISNLEGFINQANKPGEKPFQFNQELSRAAVTLPLLDNIGEVLRKEIDAQYRNGSNVPLNIAATNAISSQYGVFGALPREIKESLTQIFENLDENQIRGVLKGEDTQVLGEVSKLGEPVKRALIAIQNSAIKLSETLFQTTNQITEAQVRYAQGAQEYQNIFTQGLNSLDRVNNVQPNPFLTKVQGDLSVKALTGGISGEEALRRTPSLIAERSRLQEEIKRNPAQAEELARKLGNVNTSLQIYNTAITQSKENLLNFGRALEDRILELQQQKRDATDFLKSEIFGGNRRQNFKADIAFQALQGGASLQQLARQGFGPQDIQQGIERGQRRLTLAKDFVGLENLEKKIANLGIEAAQLGIINPQDAQIAAKIILSPEVDNLKNELGRAFTNAADIVNKQGILLRDNISLLDQTLHNKFILGIQSLKATAEGLNIPESINMTVTHTHNINITGLPNFELLEKHIKTIAEEVTGKAMQELTGRKSDVPRIIGGRQR